MKLSLLINHLNHVCRDHDVELGMVGLKFKGDVAAIVKGEMKPEPSAAPTGGPVPPKKAAPADEPPPVTKDEMAEVEGSDYDAETSF